MLLVLAAKAPFWAAHTERELRYVRCFVGHRERHLEYYKFPKDTRVASVGFVIYRLPVSQND